MNSHNARPGPAVVLIGPPGSGKTSVARALSSRLELAMRDTDADIESAEGRSVSDIFVQQGEPRFRELEVAAVATALAEHDGVLALGGGAILSDQTRAALAGRPVVYLDVSLSEEARRVGLNSARPLLLGNIRATLMKMREEREPLYRSVARWVVETDNTTIEDIATTIEGLLGEENA